jgi:hypothetical protein
MFEAATGKKNKIKERDYKKIHVRKHASTPVVYTQTASFMHVKEAIACMFSCQTIK